METTLFELWMNLWKYIYFAIECLKSKNKEEFKMSTCLKCQMVSHLNQALAEALDKIFFSETATARTMAMCQVVGNRGLWEPHYTHYRPQYGDKGGKVHI